MGATGRVRFLFADARALYDNPFSSTWDRIAPS